MKVIVNFILIFLPSFLQVPIRRVIGQNIGKGSKIKFGTLLSSRTINIGDNVTIGPFCYIRTEKLIIGDKSAIKALSVISTRIVQLGKYVHISPLSIINSEFTENSRLDIGNHSRIFPFCWLDSGEGIFIGQNVGVGGHSLIFTHGIWPNYIDGGTVNYGPVTIKDNVWLPWRVFILPNVEIGENSIVGANSLVNKSFPKNVLLGGSPAKILKENIANEMSFEQKKNRSNEILINFSKYIYFKLKIKSQFDNNKLIFNEFKIVVDDLSSVNRGDLLFIVNNDLDQEETINLNKKGISVLNHKEKNIRLVNKNIVIGHFITYLRKYGIRLYVN